MSASDLAATVVSETPGSPIWREAVTTLARLALSTDSDTATTATRVIFSEIVEPWSDRFDPRDCDRYLQFMSECLLVAGSPVQEELKSLGLGEPDKLRARARASRNVQCLAVDRERVRKVLVLSRVTLGADIAVTSVAIEAAKRAFPQAIVEFVGGAKAAAFFAGAERVRHLPVSYSRGATLRHRLNIWLELRRAVAESVEGLDSAEFVVLDPDSRLTQLGVLPIVEPEDNYRFFESRGFGGPSDETIGRITAKWCGAVIPGIEPGSLNPYVELSDEDIARGLKLRDGSQKPLAAVSLGVGGRDAKRLSATFEDHLLQALRTAGYRIVLDFGAGAAEEERARQRVGRFAGTSAKIGEAPADLVTWQGSLSAFGGLIDACDCYVGYDSASSHLAAALGVPVVEVFAGAVSERMRQRWTPTGPASVTLIPVEAATLEGDVLAALEKAIAR